jgi:hypothetical protein
LPGTTDLMGEFSLPQIRPDNAIIVVGLQHRGPVVVG